MILSNTGLFFHGRTIPCAIGRSGVTTTKREGDHATPAGRHHIAALYYRPDRLPPPAPWAIPIGPRDLWCDDPAHPAYNHPVRAPFAASHEKMRRADPLYDLILTTDWNWPDAVPGRGSAIFLHQWRRPRFPTEGCIAMARPNLIWLASRAAPGTEMTVPSCLSKYVNPTSQP